MKELTLEYATENNFTPIDCVRYFNPDWDDDLCDFFLWERTCFPHSTECVIKQLNNEFIK